jgi:ferrous iron transport protein A
MGAIALKSIFHNRHRRGHCHNNPNIAAGQTGFDLTYAAQNKPYIIKRINTADEEVRSFLFTLGCYEGQIVTVISALGGTLIIRVKDARYSIDEPMARTIVV